MKTDAVKVLIVDAAVEARQRLRAIFAWDPEVVVVGEAAGGERAIALACQLRPDVITMDARLPKLDGFETTMRIMAEAPTPVVVVTDVADAISVELSVRALQAGALTLLKMPAASALETFDASAQLFVRTVKALASVKVIRRRERREMQARRSEPPRARPQLVTIGGSTGGPAALRAILGELSASFAAPILVTQHLTPGFTTDFVHWLASTCPLSVKVAVHGEELRRGTVYVAHEQHHLKLDGRVIRFDGGAPVGGFRPAISSMFESAAQTFGERTVAVLLTGMGRDGVAGLQSVRERRGLVIAQDETSCVVFGMPRAAIEAGVVDEVLPLARIGSRLEAAVGNEGFL